MKTAEQIVRELAICQRGSEQAADLAGEAAKWVAEHDGEFHIFISKDES